MEKKYEILESLPAYGPMYVPVSENNEDFFAQGFAVRFYRMDKTSWVANFKPGWTGLNEIHEFPDLPNLLVIAGGTCYIMNPEETKPAAVFGVNYKGGLKTPNGRLVLYDLTEITVVETNCQYWHSERISWDGIKELRMEGNLVKGFAYDPMNDSNEWKAFVLDLNTREIIGGSYSLSENNKHWWKI